MCLTHVTTIGIDIFPYRNYKRWWLTWKGLRVWGKAGWVSLNSSYFARTWSRVQGLAIFSEMITISFMSNSFTRHALMSALLSREYRATVAWMLRECRVNDFIALTRLSNSPCTCQRWSIPTFGAPLESLDRQNSKSVSHSPISEHLKLAETETVSSPPFRDIGPPTHLLGVGRGNLTSLIDALHPFSARILLLILDCR